MIKNLLTFIGGLYDAESTRVVDEDQELLQSVRDAKTEWQCALNYFQQVSEPELIDYAIYKIEASRRRYMYLLNQARRNGVEDRELMHQLSEH